MNQVQTKSYEEKFSNEWIAKENYTLYGETEYRWFLKNRKDDLTSNVQSFYRGLLVLENGRKFWMSFGTKGAIDTILEVTNANHYDDLENEHHILMVGPALIGTKPNHITDIKRTLILELFTILKDAGIMRETTVVTLQHTPSRLVREDIAYLHTIYDRIIHFPDNIEIIETKDSLIATIPNPYEEVEVYSKSIVLGYTRKDSVELLTENIFKL